MNTMLSRLRRTESELEAIRRIARTVNAAADLRSILDGITKTTTEVMHVDSTSIYLLDVPTQHLVLKATTGLYPSAVDHGFLMMGQGLTGWAAQEKQVVAVREAQKDARFQEVPNTRERSFKSLLAVPLTSQDRVVGAMNVQTYRLHTWSESDIEFLTVIGDVVAGILERAVLNEQTERKVRELTAVSEVSKAVIAPVYLDETLRVVAEMAAHAVGARRCSMLLLDETENEFSPRATFDERKDTRPEPSWPIHDLPLLTIELLHEPVIVGDAPNEMRAEHSVWAQRAHLHGLLCVPMVLKERTIGLMNVWTESMTGFDDKQVEVCTTLANQLALAIENAHLVGNAAIVQEMHHRVKNNLQNVVMLLQMQLSDDGAQKRESTAKEALGEAVNRIMSIAAVHDAMAMEGFRLVDVKDVIQRVVGLVVANMTRPNLDLQIDVIGPEIRLSSRAATALALCANELVANAMEHAFVGRERGHISVNLVECGNNMLEVEVRDDGRGSAAGEIGHSLGLSIVEALVAEDLRGTFKLERNEGGSVGVITAPIAFS
jgi:two-component sensor histidine kinase